MTWQIKCVASGVLLDPAPTEKPEHYALMTTVCPACGQKVGLVDWPPRYVDHLEPAEPADPVDVYEGRLDAAAEERADWCREAEVAGRADRWGRIA